MIKKTLLTLSFMAASALSLSLSSKASAVVLFTQTQSFTNQVTELQLGPGLAFNKYTPPSNINVTSVDITVTAVLRSRGNVTNRSPSNSTFRVSVNGDYNVLGDATDTDTPAALLALNGGTGLAPFTFALVGSQVFSAVPPGAQRNFGTGVNNLTAYSITGASSYSFTVPADIAGFLGTGQYALVPLTSITTTIFGGGGNNSTAISTRADLSATITYNGDFVEVPFEFSPALGLVVLGGLYVGNRLRVSKR